MYGEFTVLAKKNSTLRFMVLLLVKYLPFQHVLNVFILKILKRQHSVVFIGSDNVMSCYAIVAPKGAAFKTVRTLGTCFFAVFFFGTLQFSDAAFLNTHNIPQTVHSKIGRQIFRITTSRNLELSATFRACNLVICSLKLFQTTKAKCMKARRYFWISEQAHKHKTGYFFIKVVFDMFLRCLTAEKHFRIFYELRGKSLTSKEVRESVGLF